MSVLVADASNPSYTTGALSTANGFYRAESSNIACYFTGTLATASEVDIAVTFANAGNCQGIILGVTGAANPMASLQIKLQKNIATVWTDQASVTYTAAQIHALSDPTQLSFGTDVFFVAFTGGTFPFAVDTAAGTWRFAITSTGGGTAWGLRQSANNVPFYVTWCDNKLSYTSNQDQLICKDTVIIDQTVTFLGALGSGDAAKSTCCVVCANTVSPTSANVSKLVWQNPPSSPYTLTINGFLVISSHGGFRVGTSGNPIALAKKATITIVAATNGTSTNTGFGGLTGGIGSAASKTNYFFYGVQPAVESAKLTAGAAVGTSVLTTDVVTGWVNGDIVAIGMQNVRSAGEVRTFYTVNNSSSNTVNLTGNITTNDRLAGAQVIKFNDYSIVIQSTVGTTGTTCSISICTNFQFRGVLLNDLKFAMNTTVGIGTDDTANFDLPNALSFSHCASRQTLATAPTSPFDIAFANHGIILFSFFKTYGQNLVNSSNFNTGGARRITFDNCIQLSGSLISFGTGLAVTVTNSYFQNSNSGAISFSSSTDCSASNCRIYGISGNAFSHGDSSFIGSNNTYDNCVTALALATGTVNGIEYGSSFGQSQANGTDINYSGIVSYTLVSPIGNLSFVSITGNMPGSGALKIASFNGVANDDRIYTYFGVIQRTGPGLSDTTAHTAGGYAARLAPLNPTADADVLTLPQRNATRIIPTGNCQGKAVTISVWALINNAAFYAGTHTNPTLNVAYDLTTNATAVAANTAGSWQQLTLTFTPTTATPYIEVWFSAGTDATSTNAYVYFDDFAMTFLTQSNGTLDQWSQALPLWPPTSTSQVTSTIQTFKSALTPAASTETVLFTVPPNASNCVVSSLSICNRGSSDTTFRVSCSLNGAATVNGDYLYYDVTIVANDTFVVTEGMTPQPGEAIRVVAGNTNLSFSIWGSYTAST